MRQLLFLTVISQFMLRNAVLKLSFSLNIQPLKIQKNKPTMHTRPLEGEKREKKRKAATQGKTSCLSCPPTWCGTSATSLAPSCPDARLTLWELNERISLYNVLASAREKKLEDIPPRAARGTLACQRMCQSSQTVFAPCDHLCYFF